MAKKSEVKKSEKLEVQENVPTYLGDVKPKGEDNFDSSDCATPQVKLLQGLSPELEDFDEAKAGLFWHTGLDIPLGSELMFVVCTRKKKYLLQAPLEDGAGILARADDARTWDKKGEWTVQIGKKQRATWAIEDLNVKKSGLAEWGTYDPSDSDSPPAATLYYEYLAILPEHEDVGPCVISLARSAIRAAKRGLNDKIAFHRSAGRPMQSLVFLAKVVKDKNSQGQEFYNWQFRSAGYASEALYKHAVKVGEILSAYRIDENETTREHAVAKPSDDADSDDF